MSFCLSVRDVAANLRSQPVVSTALQLQLSKFCGFWAHIGQWQSSVEDCF